MLDAYDEIDLSEIVTNIQRVTPAARKKMANDRVTRAFLQAALELTNDLFSSKEGSAEGEEGVRPTLSYLSKPRVLARAQQDSPLLSPTSAKFRDRWASQPQFLADFTSYALTARHWSLHLALSERARSLLLSGPSLAQAVHLVALEDLNLVLDLPAYRFQLLAVASAQTDSVAALALARMYGTLSEAWCSLYEKVFEKYKISFRPGLSMSTFNIILQATAEGLGLRLLSGVDEPIIDTRRKTSLLGTATLALFASFVDVGDGLTLEQLTERFVNTFEATPSQTGGPI